jgi:hypothetical protein
MKRIILVVLASALAFAAVGCSCSEPWVAFPGNRAPDHQYTVGNGVESHSMYVWDCIDGRHVVISQDFAEWACGSPKRETSACGEQTEIERLTAREPKQPARVPWR